ncbi:PREDICTED: uncharacterized protein LOC106723825 [Myotis brandtii]|uniref:uncharacterized protein LOC106723825 n=1 Tax=Myotis brandtii TaxID=109478 RepID=UPI0007040856|nr:PREDICTED: uncharacterized protein LOC106723825 [Myotis brandtii]
MADISLRGPWTQLLPRGTAPRAERGALGSPGEPAVPVDGLKASSFLRGDGEGLRGALSPLGTCPGDPARLRAQVLSEAPCGPDQSSLRSRTPRRSASAPPYPPESQHLHTPVTQREHELSLQPGAPSSCRGGAARGRRAGARSPAAWLFLSGGAVCPDTRLQGQSPPLSQPREVWPQHSRCQDGSVCVCVCVFICSTRVCVRVCLCARVHVTSGFPLVLWLTRLPAPRSGHSAPWTQVSALELSTFTGICSQRSRNHGLLTPPLHVIACSPPCFSQKHPAALFPIPSVYCTDRFIRQPVRLGPRCHADPVSARASPRALPLLCFEACWCRSGWWPWSPPPKPK